MPPGPSMSAPQVRDSGSRASRIVFSSSSRPKKGWRRGRLFGTEVQGPLVAVLGSGLVMLLGKPLVQGEAFEDEVGDLLGVHGRARQKRRRQRVQRLVHTRTGEHDSASFLLGELRVDSHPLPAGPLLFIVIGAKHNDDEVGLIAVELWQIDAQIVAGEFGFMNLSYRIAASPKRCARMTAICATSSRFSPAKENAMRKRLALISADISQQTSPFVSSLQQYSLFTPPHPRDRAGASSPQPKRHVAACRG